jgi:alpha-beta hydrolase superfamily lysophospholipase
MATAVVAALTAAGARRDEPILLAGHSQGGIIATRLAADPAFRRRYRVTSVLTAGSPVGHVPTPRGVAVLHVEHAGDAVPLLDHARNPGTADRLTVTRRRGTGPDAASHDAAAYARTGALIDSSRHPSVRAWRRQARAVLASPGTTATRTVYRVERPG